MKDLIVTMAASSTQGTMPLYLEQLSAAGIPTWIETNNGFDMSAGGRLWMKIKGIRALAQQFEATHRFMIVSDAWDVTFWGDLNGVLERAPREFVLWAAEKNCYPDPQMAMTINQPRPWAFANGGLSIGTPKAYLEWCEKAERHIYYHPQMLDQQFLNLQLSRNEISIDFATDLFFCLWGGYEELAFYNGKPYNTHCWTNPLFLHANGQWTAAEAFEMQRRSLEPSLNPHS